jgi:hypothetical protein
MDGIPNVILSAQDMGLGGATAPALLAGSGTSSAIIMPRCDVP